MENNNKIIEKIEKVEKSVKRNKIILILIILLLLIICLLGYKIGRIGYSTVETSNEIEDEKLDIITITDENTKWDKNAHLNIFNNAKFNGEKIIAPHSMGMYKFYVKNEVDSDITYNIRILDEMSNFVNMKYKLKLNNVYIFGDKDTYVTLDKLNLDDIVLMKDSTTLYTLEWYWEDDDEKDTYIGSLDSDEYYYLNLNILAQKTYGGSNN